MLKILKRLIKPQQAPSVLNYHNMGQDELWKHVQKACGTESHKLLLRLWSSNEAFISNQTAKEVEEARQEKRVAYAIKQDKKIAKLREAKKATWLANKEAQRVAAPAKKAAQKAKKALQAKKARIARKAQEQQAQQVIIEAQEAQQAFYMNMIRTDEVFKLETLRKLEQRLTYLINLNVSSENPELQELYTKIKEINNA